MVTTGEYDFKGNLLQGERRIAVAYATQVEWSALDGLTDLGDIEDAAESLLAAETFTTATVYDALNRPVSATTPDASEVRPTYNEAGLLEKVDIRIRGAVDWTSFVDDIDYDAKGQREKIVYGNGTATTYTYDPLTFRLKRLKTVRDSDSAVLQNLSYTYDPVGNIVAIKDTAQRTVFFNNEVVEPSTEYEYDAIYRLIQADGREHAGGIGDDQRDQNDVPLKNLPHENASTALRTYRELYGYDEVGNILSMIHQAGMAGSWTRRYEVAAGSNRLLSTSLPGDGASAPYSAHYGYDPHGNMTSMPHLLSIEWDYRDQMQSSHLGGGGMVYYTYDAGGQRARKVWNHAGYRDETIYLGGYEVFRRYQLTDDDATLVVERQTLHVMDGEKRVALVETKTVDTAAGGSFEPVTVIRFQMGNHLGSAVLEVDGEGAVISYEEYHPYGTTAYWSGASGAEVSLKRYRYTGKEKDEETGLYYYRARHYAPWLGRWTSTDPSGMIDGPGLYVYVKANPIIFQDPNGTEIYLEGMTAEQRQHALGTLQKLTNQQLNIEVVNIKSGTGGGCDCGRPGMPPAPEITRYKVIAISQPEKTTKGTELLSRLIVSKHEVLIQQGPDNTTDPRNPEAWRGPDGKQGKGSGSVVTFDFTRTEQHWVKDRATGDKKWETADQFIALGHELIHAERFARGVGSTANVVNNPEHPMAGKTNKEGASYYTAEAPEELETIGIAGYTSDVTENDLRLEQGMNKRLSHAGRRNK